jgi:hypothetical protein
MDKDGINMVLRNKSSATPVSAVNWQGLQQMSVDEVKNYIAQTLTVSFGANSDGTGTAEINITTNNSGTGTSIGTFADTDRQEATGTHPATGAVDTVTYTVKQVTADVTNLTTSPVQNVAAENGTIGFFFLNGWDAHPEAGFQNIQPGWSVVGQPTWVVTAVNKSSETVTISGGPFVSGSSYQFTSNVVNRPLKYDDGIKEMTDAQIDSEILDYAINAMITETTYAAGQYRLQPTAPSGGTWVARYTLTDVANGGNTVTYLWQKTAATTLSDSNLRPLRLIDTKDVKEMSSSEILQMLPSFRNRIIDTGIGTYKVQSSAPASGTWVEMGNEFADTREQVTPQNYLGNFSGNYLGTFSGSRNYSAAYVGNYSGSFANNFSGGYVGPANYSGAYSGAYANNFSGGYVGPANYSGTYSQGFSGNYVGNFVGTAGYSGNYTRNFSGNYTGFYAGSRNYSGNYAGNYSGNYLGNFSGNYLGTYSRNFSGTYLGNFTGNYTGFFVTNYSGAYVKPTRFETFIGYFGGFAGNFVSAQFGSPVYTGFYAGPGYAYFFAGTYASNFTGNYLGNFSGNYLGTYASNFTGNYTGFFAGSRNYAGNYAGTYLGNFLGFFTGNYVGPATYTGTYSGTYTGFFSGNYLGTATYTGNYTGFFTGFYTGFFAGTATYTGNYTGFFSGNYTGYYSGSRNYAGNYASNFSGTYSNNFSGATVIATKETVSTIKLWVRTT